MFGVSDLSFGRVGASSSPSDDMASSYHLSSSVPFGFSIQEAIKELSLEEDGDVDTFLNKSAALMAAASPPSLTAFSRSYLLSNSDENPSLSLITLQKASCT